MRYEIEHRATVTGHDDRLAVFHGTGKLGKTILGISNRDGLHPAIVATSVYGVKL